MKKKIVKKVPRLIQSIQRASDILGLFVNEKGSLGITDFSLKLKLPKTTIQGIVKTLASLDYLEKDPVTSKYGLGPMLFQLGMKYATNLDFVNITRGWLERLCFQFRQPVNAGMLVGDRVVLVLRVEPDNRFMVFPQVGSVIPTHSSAIGKSLFAHMEEDRRDALLSGYGFEPLTRNTITNAEDFLRELDAVRREGVAFDNQENIIGLSGIGAPVRNHTGQVVAAFAITGDTAVIEAGRDEIVDNIKNVAALISSQLGFVK